MMILLTSHGSFCRGAFDTVEMIAGNENLDYLVFDGKSVEKYEKQLKLKLDNVKEEVVICTDILGGTPYNICVKNYGKQDNIKIISGFNIPLVIALKYAESIAEIENLISEQTITIYKEVESVDEEIEL